MKGRTTVGGKWGAGRYRCTAIYAVQQYVSCFGKNFGEKFCLHSNGERGEGSATSLQSVFHRLTRYRNLVKQKSSHEKSLQISSELKSPSKHFS